MSHSTTEAEMIALELALRQELLPFLDLWEAVLQMYHTGAGEQAVGKPLPASADPLVHVVETPPIEIWNDNEAVLKIIVQRNFRKLRRVHRTHRVNLAWITNMLAQAKPSLHLFHVPSAYQLADIFTKAYDSTVKWKHACALVGLFHEQDPLSNLQRYVYQQKPSARQCVKTDISCSSGAFDAIPSRAVPILATSYSLALEQRTNGDSMEQQNDPTERQQEQTAAPAATGGSEAKAPAPSPPPCAAAAVQAGLPPLPPLMPAPYPALTAQAGGQPLPGAVQKQAVLVPGAALTFEQQVQLQHDLAQERQYPTIAELQARLLDIQRQQQQTREAQQGGAAVGQPPPALLQQAGAAVGRPPPAPPSLPSSSSSGLLRPIPLLSQTPQGQVAGGQPLPQIARAMMSQSAWGLAAGEPLPTVAQVQNMMQVAAVPTNLPPIKIPLMTDMGHNFAVAATLKNVMGEAGWNPGASAPERPLWRWLTAVAEQIAMLDGRPAIVRPEQSPQAALRCVVDGYLQMEKASFGSQTMWQTILEHATPQSLQQARQHCYDVAPRQKIAIVSDSTLVMGKRGGKSGLEGYAMPRQEFRTGAAPAHIFDLWAQCGAEAPQLAQQVDRLTPDPDLHIVVYWSLNDIVKKRKTT